MASKEAATTGVPWQVVALASGAFAAFNGLFAKLTTNSITSQWISQIATFLNIEASPNEQYVAYVVRGLVLILSFVSTSVMWMLFTSALSRSPSAVHANILNTIANFVLTAIIGNLLFAERLPGLWWVGASMLIAGGVIIGQRDSEEKETTPMKNKSE